MPELTHKKTVDMDGLRYSSDDPDCRLGPHYTCLYVRACRLLTLPSFFLSQLNPIFYKNRIELAQFEFGKAGSIRISFPKIGLSQLNVNFNFSQNLPEFVLNPQGSVSHA